VLQSGCLGCQLQSAFRLNWQLSRCRCRGPVVRQCLCSQWHTVHGCCRQEDSVSQQALRLAVLLDVTQRRCTSFLFSMVAAVLLAGSLGFQHWVRQQHGCLSQRTPTEWWASLTAVVCHPKVVSARVLLICMYGTAHAPQAPCWELLLLRLDLTIAAVLYILVAVGTDTLDPQ
jgi:hypothetical protein